MIIAITVTTTNDNSKRNDNDNLGFGSLEVKGWVFWGNGFKLEVQASVSPVIISPSQSCRRQSPLVGIVSDLNIGA